MPLRNALQLIQRTWPGLALVCMLSACSSLKPPQENLDPPPKVEATSLDAQDYITKVDLARIKLGMNTLEVKNRIGAAMLGDPNPDRWDYVVKEGRGPAEHYNTWGVYFKDGKVVQIAQVQASPTQAVVELPPETLPAALPPLEPSNKPSMAAKQAPPAKIKPELNHVASPKKQDVPVASDTAAVQQEDLTAEIGSTLRAWVAAWSGKKTNTYLAFYADNFKHGMASRSAWLAQRRARLSAPGNITLDLSAIQVSLISPKQAEVKFVQRYKSDAFSDQGKKRMVLVRQGNAWKILEEAFDK